MHREPFFVHLEKEPDRLAAFLASMADRAAREADAVVEVYDVARFSPVVDVGGGTGALLRAVRARAPRTDLVLFDRPDVVAGSDLPSVGGNFFDEVPAGADAYLLSRVLHDWDDRDALRILRVPGGNAGGLGAGRRGGDRAGAGARRPPRRASSTARRRNSAG